MHKSGTEGLIWGSALRLAAVEMQDASHNPIFAYKQAPDALTGRW
jgi:hypothetical protein